MVSRLKWTPPRLERHLFLIREVFEKMDNGSYPSESKISPYIYTPRQLCQEKLDKIVEHREDLSGNILVLNPEYISLLLSNRYNISESTIYFYTDDVYMKQVVEAILSEYPDDENVEIIVDDTSVDDILGCFFEGNSQDNSTNRDVKMKFDVIAGNPPYDAPQNSSSKRGGGSSLWDEFVDKSLNNLLKENGYLTLVHPSLWRKPQTERSWCSDLQPKMLNREVKFLSINDEEDGRKVFDAGTRFDWYLIKNNKKESSTTLIKDERGNSYDLNLSDWNWIPNHSFKLISELLNGDNNVNVIYDSSSYETRKSWTKKRKSGEYKYPLIHTTPKSGVRYYYSSRNDLGHFGKPKVIFGDSGVQNAVVDFEGKYGMTQHAIGISIDSLEEGEKIKEVLQTEVFKRILDACSWSNYQIDWKMFRSFKKKWYEIVLEKSNN